MFISKNRIIAIIACFFSILSTANADQKPIVVGGMIAAPNIMLDEEGQASGIIVDQIKQASKIAKIPVEFRLNNWARSLQEIKGHRIDALIPTMYSEDRTDFLIYPKTPIAIWKSTLFKKKSATIHYSGEISDLKPYRVGRLRNARVCPTFDMALKNKIFQVDEKNSVSLLMRNLQKGRIDLAAISLNVGLWAAQQEGIRDEIEPIEPSLGEMPVYLAFSKQNVSLDIVNKFDAIFDQFRADDTLEKITKKYIN